MAYSQRFSRPTGVLMGFHSFDLSLTAFTSRCSKIEAYVQANGPESIHEFVTEALALGPGAVEAD
jgi:hypothetical protein